MLKTSQIMGHVCGERFHQIYFFNSPRCIVLTCLLRLDSHRSSRYPLRLRCAFFWRRTGSSWLTPVIFKQLSFKVISCRWLRPHNEWQYCLQSQAQSDPLFRYNFSRILHKWKSVNSKPNMKGINLLLILTLTRTWNVGPLFRELKIQRHSGGFEQPTFFD